jgi:hypothetical protein
MSKKKTPDSRSQRFTTSHFTTAWHLSFIFAVFIVLAGVRLHFPELTHGDDHADASVLIAGRNFDRLGFVNLRFIHIWNPQAVDARHAYLYHPPGAEIIHGLLRRLFGEQPITFYRTFALLLSLLGLLALWCAVECLLASRAAATTATFLLLCNPVYISLFDSIHQSPYTELYRSVAFCAIILALRSSQLTTGRARLFVAIFVTCSFLNALHTFESVLGIFLMGVLSVLWVGRWSAKRVWLFAIMAGLAPAVAITLRLGINAWHYGSLGHAIEDFIHRAVERSIAAGDISGVRVTLDAWMDSVLAGFVTRVFEVPIPAVIAIVLMLWAIAAAQRDNTGIDALKVLIILIVSGLTWYLIMPAHSLSHSGLSFMHRHLLLPSALLWTLLARSLWRGLPSALPQVGATVVGFLGALPIGLICLSGILKSELPLTSEKQAREREFALLKRQLRETGVRYPKEAEFATNYFRQPMVAWYLDRMVYMVQTPKDFDSLRPNPTTFLLIPFADQATRVLSEHLEARGYRLVDAQQNGALPFYVFQKLAP